MSRHYTPEEKHAALETLRRNSWNITRTAHETSIPERTLYRWWQNWRRQTPSPPLPSSPPPAPIPEFQDTTEAMTYIRQRIINELLTLIQTFDQDFALASPYQRVMAITHLLDRVLKLDHYSPPQERIIRIEYEDPKDAFR